MSGARRFVSPAEASLHNRKLREEQQQADAVLAKAAAAQQEEAHDFGSSDPGRKLRRELEEENRQAIKTWLSANPLGPDFPTRSIQLHTALKRNEELIRRLTPKEIMDGGQGSDRDSN